MALGEERDLVPLGAGFDITKRGYSRVQVEEHLENVDSQLRILAADRDAAAGQAGELTAQLEAARTRIDDLTRQVDQLSQPPTTMEGLSPRLQRMLRLNIEECEENRAKAQADAEHIRLTSEAEATKLRERYEGQLAAAEARRQEMEDEHVGVVEKARIDAAKQLAEAAAERARLDTESEQRRAQVEEDFEIAMASRRTESMRALAEQEATSKSEAERRVREATEEANRRRHDSITESKARLQEATDESHRRVREATEESNRRINHAAQRVTALRQLRSRVATQLRSARDLVADANAQLENAAPAFEPLEEEREAELADKPSPNPGPRERPELAGPAKEPWEPDGVPSDAATKRLPR
ncbi:MAG TPA: hypothetical protein VK631_23565 [Solirubrobacteraceae bacterium]|nr:hypothetical protein [Solirubrobacteraceae bacterium]